MSENDDLNERDANELVNEIEQRGETIRDSRGDVIAETKPEPNDFALTLANPDYPVLGKQVYELARQQRMHDMEQAVIDFVSREMHTYAALQVEQKKTNKAMQKIERRLAAIKTGRFTLDPRTAAITFEDKEL